MAPPWLSLLSLLQTKPLLPPSGESPKPHWRRRRRGGRSRGEERRRRRRRRGGRSRGEEGRRRSRRDRKRRSRKRR